MTTNDDNGSWDALLTSTPKEGETYVQPNIEIKLSKNKRQACRDILLEIKNFGVSQRQMLYLIYLMALELEDQETMKAIVKVVGDHRENTPLVASDTDKAPKSTIILPGQEDK